MSRQNTRLRILDTAEHVFARDGFRDTTLRSITAEAGVNLASVNYYFGSKEKLIEEVFKRHVVPLNQLRQEKLNSARRSAADEGNKLSVEKILRIFIDPTVSKFEESGDKNKEFMNLMHSLHQENEGPLWEMFMDMMKPAFTQFVDALSEAHPEFPGKVIVMRMLFVIGSMVKTLQAITHKDSLPGHFGSYDDKETLIDMLVQFVTAGMEAPWHASGE